MAEEIQQVFSQSQEDGAKMTAMSLQLQELISLMEERSKAVGTNLEEVNDRFDCHCQEIGLVALMFFFELLFSYVSLAISFYVSFTNLFPIILFLIC